MELPELAVLAEQMDKEISGNKIAKIEVANPKCLNMPLDRFQKTVIGKTIRSVKNKGKWLFFHLNDNLALLFNPGMGADVIHFGPNDKVPEKYQIKLVLNDQSGFTVRVWWFCYLHLMQTGKLSEHKLVGKLGANPLDKSFTLDNFKQLVRKKGGSIKTFLLDQKNIAGIGNVYIQDMLFKAKLHPQRKTSSLTDKEIEALYKAMRTELNNSIRMGGLAYEKDFYGNKGRYGADQFKIAYKLGKPCPVCGTTIQKIKTGSTSTFICPKCQPLDK
jgi:formamidopyrimidine-DNA glycosylase